MEYFIGLDIGTSSIKGIAFDAQAEPLAEAQVDYEFLASDPEIAEQEPSEIVEAAITALKSVVEEMGEQPVAVSLSSAMHSLILIDVDGQPLTKVITWADSRAKAQADQLKGTDLGKDIYRHTGTPIHPMSPLCKLAWLRENESALFAQATLAVGIKEYLLHHFFEEWVTDISIASATGLLNIQDANWYAPALEFAGITAEQLPTLVAPTHLLEGLQASISEKTGLDPEIPFVVGGSDGCLANLGALAIRPGEAAITIGTSGAVRVAAKEWQYDEQERIFNYYLTKDTYILGGATNNGGVVMEWFIEHFMADQDFSKVFDELAELKPGSADLFFLPYIYGERAPVWNSDARGIFLGIHSRHTPVHFARAVAEGILFNIVEILLALEETTGTIREIYANGGFAESDIWVQMLADISGKPVILSQTNQASALGAVFMGMLALQKVDSLDDFYASRQTDERFEPDHERHEQYQVLLEHFRQIYPKFNQ